MNFDRSVKLVQLVVVGGGLYALDVNGRMWSYAWGHWGGTDGAEFIAAQWNLCIQPEDK